MGEGRRILVAGGGYSGVLAAVRAAKLLRGAGEVVLVNDRDHFVERIRLHEHAVRGRQILWSIPDLLRGSRVTFRRAMVTALDLQRRVVRDVVQDAFIRWQQNSRESVVSAERFLAKTVTRLALDHLALARAPARQVTSRHYGNCSPNP